jgi:CxxC-x17-CxxC domain-containing protein
MSEITFFAQTTFRNQMRRFGIKKDDRRRHMYLIGKTGMGKSTILENMIIDDIRAGHGVGVVDPHGDLAEKIIEFIPDERIKDVIYFNPSDIEFPIAFNVVEQVEPHLRHLVASGLIGVFQKLWADSWGPRLEYILRNAILAILDYPGSTLLGVVRILSDKVFRKKVVSNIKDPVVKAFWEKEFASYADKFASEAVSPIQNKVGQFLSTAFMRNIIGQTESSLNMREIMDGNKILIMNLSKGRIGEDNSALLGAMMITKIQMAAMSRVNMPEEQRNDFYLYIDEFQNFSTDSFANILSEARKYRLCLIMAHQYIEQLSEKVKPAVFGNVGTMIVFRVGATDAEELVKEFTPTFTEEDIVNLPKYEMYLKLMIDGIASDPFSAKGLPPLSRDEKTHNVEKVIAFTRETYAGSKEEVEEKILKWHSDEDDSPRPKNITPSDSRYADDEEKPAYVPKPAYAPKPAYVPKPASTPTSTSTPSPLTPPTKSYQVSSVAPKTYTAPTPTKTYAPPVKPAPERKSDDEHYKYEAVCHNCGNNTKISFQPDGVRPVYCKDCLEKIKKQKEDGVANRKLAKEREVLQLKTQPEIIKKVEDPAPVPAPVKTLSLNDLSNLAPVDFKGRNMKKPEPLPEKEEDEKEEDGEEEKEYKKEAVVSEKKPEVKATAPVVVPVKPTIAQMIANLEKSDPSASLGISDPVDSNNEKELKEGEEVNL